MYKDILPVLYCPKCKVDFKLEEQNTEADEVIEGCLVCKNGHRFPIYEGVACFGAEEQAMANQWSEQYKKKDYETIDKEIEGMKSLKEKEQEQKVIDAINAGVSELERGYVVDIASGRGMLLSQLILAVKESVNVIATDLSFEVLMYDRIKMKKICPKARVSYIACDAADMPLKTATADVCVSFFGIPNMVGMTEEGMREAARVTKTGGKLLDSYVLIKEDSEGFRSLKKLCTENNLQGAENVCIEKSVRELHDRYFSSVYENIVVEDVKEKQKEQLDLLPYPGEWFAEVVYISEK